ncbi:EAL domain-containing protein [Candidatus Methylospira mobilis]|uniref:EAL domain-containing protein n=1 Tax=Candidatus Methylospira mobilis TaxID=1808979 RepID=A0A5Q0BGN8_9GAMM|nr:EAL domain-containing protein [Candidatus Methylospira mobilis]QFY41288.1 EAL domain-containing protein [Candidatus Methylospira mobilis]WNV05490.1 EAL domain-containing protein [Candidatus Methylospira mobilis]
MTDTNPSLFLNFIGKTAGLVAALLGLSVLSGWTWENPLLKHMVIGQAPMKPNVALAFILTGLALSLTPAAAKNPALRFLVRLLAGSTLMFILATLSQYLTGQDLGIDQMLFTMPDGIPFTNTSPGRITPQGGICFILLNGAILALQQPGKRGAALLMAALATVIPTITLGNYLFCAPLTLYPKQTGLMTTHGTLGLLVLSIGALAYCTSAQTYERIRLRLPAILFTVALLLMLLSGSALRVNSHQLRLTYASVTQSIDILRLLESVMTEVEIISATNHGFLLTGQMDCLPLLARSRERLVENLKLLSRHSLRDAAQQQKLNTLQKQTEELFRLTDQTSELRKQTRLEDVAKAVTSQYDGPLIKEIRKLVTEMEQVEEVRLQERQNQALSSNNSTSLATGLTGLTGVFFIIIAFLRLRQHLAEKIRAERSAAREQTRLNTILRATSDGVHIFDHEGRLVMANQAFLDMLGYDESVVGHMRIPDWDIDHDEIKSLQAINIILTADTLTCFETRHQHRDGHLIDVEITARPFTLDDSTFICAASRDITQQKQNGKRLARVGMLYTAMLHCNEAIIHCRNENALLDTICRITMEDGQMCMVWIGVADYNKRSIVPVAWYDEQAKTYLDGIEISMQADGPEGCGPTGTALRENKPIFSNNNSNPGLELWKIKYSGFDCLSSAAIPISRGGQVWGVLSVYSQERGAFDEQITGLLQNMCNNISFALNELDSARARAVIEEKLTLSDRVFNETHEGIIITDVHNLIIDVNPAFCAITGYTRDEAIGQTPRFLRSGKQPPEFYTTLWCALTETGHWQGELWNRKKNGDLYAERLTISALRDDHGIVLHYVALFSDITQTKQQQQALELMAHYDALTQLPNRVLFAKHFNQAISYSRRESALLAVCYLDLDGFKQVNDSLGHDAGDQLLIEVANRIQSSLRGEDTLSRLGGDEFALLINDLQSFDECEQVLVRIHQAIAQPYLIGGQAVNVAASTGVTLYPRDDADPDTLLRHADQAMYLAKTSGRNRYCLFDSEQAQQMQRQSRQLEQIEAAFVRKEFCLFYQPKVNMSSGEVVGMEALIRWNHPERGIVAPAAFLPAVEGSAFEIVLGNWVIDTALAQLDSWRGIGLEIEVSVNIAPRHLQDPDFFITLHALLAQHPVIPARRLQLEVVESSVLNDLGRVSEVIALCRRELGVGFALDDFGTGYSSLTYLRRLPVDSVKIDQSFVRDMIDDPEDHAIVNGVIALARAFKREVVAEGVETCEHGTVLLNMGCELAQGYGIARPMPAEAIASWVSDYRTHARWQRYSATAHQPCSGVENE